MHREIFHGNRWNTDPRFFTPMIITNDMAVFLRDCVAFYLPQFGMTTAIVVKGMYTLFNTASASNLDHHLGAFLTKRSASNAVISTI